jgi:hypothetical protein
MLCFPQLLTGAAAIYPVRRRRSGRTVVNAMADGRRVVYADPDFSLWMWELRPAGLAEEEWEAVQSLFEAVSGRAGTFTFLDPAGNLLAQSEALDAPEWDNGPLIGLTPGIDDPFGGTAAMRALNSSGVAAGAIAQTLPVPGVYRYALSVWARAVAGSGVTLFASAGAAGIDRSIGLSPQWRRVWVPVSLAQAAESVTFGVKIAAAAQVDLFGMQVDAQPAPGGYQRTASQGGVHARARFAHDSLVVRAQGTDVFDTAIRVVSKGN